MKWLHLSPSTKEGQWVASRGDTPSQWGVSPLDTPLRPGSTITASLCMLLSCDRQRRCSCCSADASRFEPQLQAGSKRCVAHSQPPADDGWVGVCVWGRRCWPAGPSLVLQLSQTPPSLCVRTANERCLLQSRLSNAGFLHQATCSTSSSRSSASNRSNKPGARGDPGSPPGLFALSLHSLNCRTALQLHISSSNSRKQPGWVQQTRAARYRC